MKAVRILDENQLDELVVLSTWVWEGLNPTQENIDWIVNELGLDEHNTIFVCYGQMINAHYGLTHNNAYPNDFPFVFIYDYYDVEKRIAMGAKWFDVVVENNLIMQEIIEEEDGEE